MSGWEESLPPIMREKLARIGEATPEERERIKALDELGSLLSAYYKGEVDSEGLWKELKGRKEEGKGYLLKEAQIRLMESLGLGSADSELQRRREGVLAIETIKEEQNITALEAGLNSLIVLKKRYREGLEGAYESLKAQVERNPELRMQQVRQGQTTMVVQLSVDEAIKNSQEWRNFAASHERQYTEEFARIIEGMKGELG